MVNLIYQPSFGMKRKPNPLPVPSIFRCFNRLLFVFLGDFYRNPWERSFKRRSIFFHSKRFDKQNMDVSLNSATPHFFTPQVRKSFLVGKMNPMVVGETQHFRKPLNADFCMNMSCKNQSESMGCPTLYGTTKNGMIRLIELKKPWNQNFLQQRNIHIPNGGSMVVETTSHISSHIE